MRILPHSSSVVHLFRQLPETMSLDTPKGAQIKPLLLSQTSDLSVLTSQLSPNCMLLGSGWVQFEHPGGQLGSVSDPVPSGPSSGTASVPPSVVVVLLLLVAVLLLLLVVVVLLLLVVLVFSPPSVVVASLVPPSTGGGVLPQAVYVTDAETANNSAVNITKPRTNEIFIPSSPRVKGTYC